MKYRIWLWLLLLTLLVGCASPAAPATEPVLILWHTFSGAERQALQRISDAFNADNPWGLHLVVEYQEQILEKITQAAPEQRPDLVAIWPESMGRYRQAGLAADLTPLPPGMRLDTGDLLPMAQALFSEQGQLQGIPLGLTTYMIYYNADWLSELGYNEAPTTWEDLRRVACAASDPAKAQVGLGLPTTAGALMTQLAATGAPLNDANGNYTLFQSDTRIAMANLHALFTDKCADQYAFATEGMEHLSNHSRAMIIDSSAHLAAIEEYRLQGRRFSMILAPVPNTTGAGTTLWYGPGLLLIAPEGPRRQAALQTLNWFLSPEAQAIWYSKTQQLPVRRSFLSARLQEVTTTIAENDLFTLTLEIAENGRWAIWPNHPNTAECRAALLEGLYSIEQIATPEVMLRRIQNRCQGNTP